jgi:hypothetical protein
VVDSSAAESPGVGVVAGEALGFGVGERVGVVGAAGCVPVGDDGELAGAGDGAAGDEPGELFVGGGLFP